MIPRIVIDTNVFLSALQSRNGASFVLFSNIDSKKFSVHLSVPLLLEYEEIAKQRASSLGLTLKDIDAILNYVCAIAQSHQIHYLWRPYLKDPEDDHVLELAVEAHCDVLLTYNQRDFLGIARFGIRVMTPKEFLKERGFI